MLNLTVKGTKYGKKNNTWLTEFQCKIWELLSHNLLNSLIFYNADCSKHQLALAK